MQRFAGHRLYAFSGLAANHAFRQSLEKGGVEICGFGEFPDHHFYRSDDIDKIVNNARACGASCLCTTDKDWVKFHRQVRWPLALAVMGVDIKIGTDAHSFENELRSRLNMAG